MVGGKVVEKHAEKRTQDERERERRGGEKRKRDAKEDQETYRRMRSRRWEEEARGGERAEKRASASACPINARLPLL